MAMFAYKSSVKKPIQLHKENAKKILPKTLDQHSSWNSSIFEEMSHGHLRLLPQEPQNMLENPNVQTQYI